MAWMAGYFDSGKGKISREGIRVYAGKGDIKAVWVPEDPFDDQFMLSLLPYMRNRRKITLFVHILKTRWDVSDDSIPKRALEIYEESKDRLEEWWDE